MALQGKYYKVLSTYGAIILVNKKRGNKMAGLLEIEYYRGVAIMFNTIMGKYYFYPELTKGARYFKTFEGACEAIDKMQVISK